MIRLDARSSVRFCDGATRRDFLHAGSLSVLGLSLSQVAAARGVPAKDMNCIMLFLVGGPSQVDTWDPKPDAPSEVRGLFSPIATRVPGVQISELFPRMAGHMDKVSLIRSVYHTATAVHDTGHQMMQTGRLFSGGLEHPHIGCVASYLLGSRDEAPPHVLIPRPIGNTGGNLPHGQNAGYLGKSFDPFVLNADPSKPDFQVPNLLPPGYISAARESRRRSFRATVDSSIKDFEASADARLLDANFQQAYAIMSSAKTREAFDLKQEPDAVRDRYGRTKFGQSCLLGRRLIERGVRFVTINQFETVFNELTWDSHGSSPFTSVADYPTAIAPSFDNAYSSLLEDLDQRGLLESTVILAFGEFGRTPKMNPAGGRDHHPNCWTALMAGGPIRGGRVVGASDEIGFAPRDRPVTPAEIAATAFHALGLPLETDLPGPQGRPIPLVDRGVEPIHELF